MLKRILSIYRNYKKQVAVVLSFTFLIQAFGILNPYVFGKMMDSVIKREDMVFSISLAVTCLLIAGLQNFAATSRIIYNQKNLFFPVKEFVRMQSLQRYLGFSIGQLKNNHSGVSRDVMSNGEAALVNLARIAVMVFLPTMARIIITSIVLMYLQPSLGVIILSGASVYFAIILFLQRKYMPLMERMRDSFLETGKHRSEILSGASLIIAHTQEESMVGLHQEKNHESSLIAVTTNRFMNVRNNSMMFFMGAVEYSAMIWGIYLIYQGKMTVGSLVTVRMWWGMITSSIADLGAMYPDVLDNMSDVKKFFSLIDIPPAITEVENSVRLRSVTGFVNFQHVSFAYPNSEEIGKRNKSVLKDVSLQIRGGERVAIVGPSGSGKTTLITLLLRGYDPDAGCITIDGVNLKSLNLKDFRQKVAIVDQGTPMFDDTLRNNILFGTNTKLPDEELTRICDLAQINFAEKMVDGLDTVIGQNGVKISGGERQRVAIARALARNPDLLILDEATSSLDTINESKIRKAIEEVSKNRTVITVAHRLSTVRSADRIFVMEDGRIVSVGSHEELLGKSVLYQELVEHQMVRA